MTKLISFVAFGLLAALVAGVLTLLSTGLLAIFIAIPFMEISLIVAGLTFIVMQLIGIVANDEPFEKK